MVITVYKAFSPIFGCFQSKFETWKTEIYMEFIGFYFPSRKLGKIVELEIFCCCWKSRFNLSISSWAHSAKNNDFWCKLHHGPNFLFGTHLQFLQNAAEVTQGEEVETPRNNPCLSTDAFYQGSFKPYYSNNFYPFILRYPVIHVGNFKLIWCLKII